MRTNKMGLHFLLPLIIALLACNKPQESLSWINGYTPTTQGDPESGEPDDPGNPDDPTTPSTPVTPGEGYIIVGYDYDSSEKSNLPDPTLLTHINFAFGKIDVDYKTLKLGTTKKARLKNIVALKKINPNLKVCLSIGGWEAGNFSEMAADPALRKAFCENCRLAVNEDLNGYHLDGIDIDWEYPTNNSCKPKPANQAEDKANFTLLIKELRATLGPDKLVTMAASANAGAGYVNFPEFIDDMDWVNIMTYDMGSPKDNPARFNAALEPSGNKTKRSCLESVNAHIAAGVPARKLVLGVPFYGRDDNVTFTADDDDNYVSYKDILDILDSGKYKECWDKDAKVPYLTNTVGTMVLSYDDEESIGLKANFVKERGLLGAMYWCIKDDDSNRTLARALSTRLIGTGYQEGSASIPSYQVTNSYVQKYMEGVKYTDWNLTENTQVFQYEGGGPGEADVPPSVTISWKAASTSQTLKVWDDDWSREYSLGSGVSSQSISNLVPNSHYHYKVTNSGNNVVARGEFKTTGALHQVYFNKNVRNARDLGGLKTLDGKTIRYRMLYRGGRTDNVKDDGKAEVEAVGIKAELDLTEENHKTSYFGSSYAYCAPIFGESENYGTMLRECQPRIKQSIDFIFDNIKKGNPVYFHCAAGRDRTGTIAALLLALLNVREADIARDYELTYFAPESWSMSTNQETGEKYFNHTRNVGSYTRLVTYIRDFGNAGSLPLGAEKYLLSIGVSQQDINDFKTIMLK